MSAHSRSTATFPAHPNQGYFAHLGYQREGDFEHWLGGEQSMAQCPNCRKPLLQLMSLDLRDRNWISVR
jgi:hypothetical protein